MNLLTWCWGVSWNNAHPIATILCTPIQLSIKEKLEVISFFHQYHKFEFEVLQNDCLIDWLILCLPSSAFDVNGKGSGRQPQLYLVVQFVRKFAFAALVTSFGAEEKSAVSGCYGWSSRRRRWWAWHGSLSFLWLPVVVVVATSLSCLEQGFNWMKINTLEWNINPDDDDDVGGGSGITVLQQIVKQN